MGGEGARERGRFQGPCTAITFLSPVVPSCFCQCCQWSSWVHRLAVAGACYVALLGHFGVFPDCNEGERFISRWRALAPQVPSGFPLEKGGGHWEGGIVKPQECTPRDAEICESLTRVKRTLLTWVPREAVPRDWRRYDSAGVCVYAFFFSFSESF